MNTRSIVPFICLFTLICLLSTQPAAKDFTAASQNIDIQPSRLYNAATGQIKKIQPQLSAADTCFVGDFGEASWLIYPWVIGDELYKAYQDPAATCGNPWPFLVEAVHYVVYVLAPSTFVISVDVESIDNSTPGCPRPGTILSISSAYEVAVDTGLWILEVPLDDPISVNGPYFAGVYIGPGGNPGETAVVTDNTPMLCRSYNDWGEGYVDLDTVTNINDGTKIFPGRLMIYTAGQPGGGGGTGGDEPAPVARFIEPTEGRLVGSSVELWADDAAGSNIISRAVFEYDIGGAWLTIGSDIVDDPPLRNGVTASGDGDGLTVFWTTTGLPEKNYPVRAIISDTLGRADTTGMIIHVDPTPPFGTMTSPANGDNVCTGVMATVTVPDEDVSYVSFEYKPASAQFSLPVSPISQYLAGDTDGDPYDGNPAGDGEYGDYCSGPAAAASILLSWVARDSKYLPVIQESTTTLDQAQIADRLFEAMRIAENLGTLDNRCVAGIREYIQLHDGGFDVTVDRNPTAAELNHLLQNNECPVMVGLTGAPGRWLVASGGGGLANDAGVYSFTFIDPEQAISTTMPVKEEAGQLMVQYDIIWYPADILVCIIPDDHEVSRNYAGIDMNASGGWGFFWNTESLSEDSLYFLHAVVTDAQDNETSTAQLVKVDCMITYIPGDMNNDGSVNPADLVYMTNYLYGRGPAPPAGNAVVDVNCDALVDLSDIIYFYKYLFQSGPAPCP